MRARGGRRSSWRKLKAAHSHSRAARPPTAAAGDPTGTSSPAAAVAAPTAAPLAAAAGAAPCAAAAALAGGAVRPSRRSMGEGPSSAEAEGSAHVSSWKARLPLKGGPRSSSSDTSPCRPSGSSPASGPKAAGEQLGHGQAEQTRVSYGAKGPGGWDARRWRRPVATGGWPCPPRAGALPVMRTAWPARTSRLASLRRRVRPERATRGGCGRARAS
jgi:hypothetical protein